MKEKRAKNTKTNVSLYEDFEERTGNKPNVAKKKKTSYIQKELADDYGEILGDGFHGLDDDYYFDEDDI
jgi:hypothetical protein